MGDLYLSNIDFLKNGVPASIIATLVSTSSSFAPCKCVADRPLLCRWSRRLVFC